MNKQEFEQVFAAAAEKSGVAELARKNQFAENLETMMCELRDKFNFLPAEQPNMELEDAADAYANANPGIYRENGRLFDDYDKPKNDFIAGANWQKQQMLKSAVNGIMDCDDSNEWVEIIDRFIVTPARAGEKVKILIIKEDE